MPSNAFSTIRLCRLMGCVLGGLFLTSCSAAENQAPGTTPSLLEKLLGAPTFGEKSQSCGTVLQCKAALKAMIDDPKRSWVGQRQSAGAFADGTRLFAYRGLRAKLSCAELALAMNEIRAGAKSLVEPVPGVAPDRASRTRALAAQIEAELQRERSGRCKP
jgi:hypothetical protein